MSHSLASETGTVAQNSFQDSTPRDRYLPSHTRSILIEFKCPLDIPNFFDFPRHTVQRHSYQQKLSSLSSRDGRRPQIDDYPTFSRKYSTLCNLVIRYSGGLDDVTNNLRSKATRKVGRVDRKVYGIISNANTVQNGSMLLGVWSLRKKLRTTRQRTEISGGRLIC